MILHLAATGGRPANCHDKVSEAGFILVEQLMFIVIHKIPN